MLETPLLSFVAQALAGTSLGAGYRALRIRTQQRARTARHPELLVVGGLVARLAGLACLVALISRGTLTTVFGLLAGIALAWLLSWRVGPPRQGSPGLI